MFQLRIQVKNEEVSPFERLKVGFGTYTKHGLQEKMFHCMTSELPCM